MWNRARDYELAMLKSIDERLNMLFDRLVDVERRLQSVDNAKASKSNRKALLISIGLAAISPVFVILWQVVIK